MMTKQGQSSERYALTKLAMDQGSVSRPADLDRLSGIR
jgi:hypothetical protein